LLPSGVFCLDNCISIKFVPFVEVIFAFFWF
jgi:hypothetical protein